MSRITCRECGKVWPDQAAFNENPGCSKMYCTQNTNLLGLLAEVTKPKAKIHVHVMKEQVLSTYDKAQPFDKIIVADAIYTNIFPR